MFCIKLAGRGWECIIMNDGGGGGGGTCFPAFPRVCCHFSNFMKGKFIFVCFFSLVLFDFCNIIK